MLLTIFIRLLCLLHQHARFIQKYFKLLTTFWLHKRLVLARRSDGTYMNLQFSFFVVLCNNGSMHTAVLLNPYEISFNKCVVRLLWI